MLDSSFCCSLENVRIITATAIVRMMIVTLLRIYASIGIVIGHDGVTLRVLIALAAHDISLIIIGQSIEVVVIVPSHVLTIAGLMMQWLAMMMMLRVIVVFRWWWIVRHLDGSSLLLS